MHQAAPITGGGSDEVEMSATLSARMKKHEQTVRKWSLLWRSIILSCLGKTLFPYCRYIRDLNLSDLEALFDNQKFRSSINE
jgi:hypothetical protein